MWWIQTNRLSIKNSLSVRARQVPGFCTAATVQGYLAYKKQPPIGPYINNMLGALWWPYGVGQFLMSEVPLHGRCCRQVGQFAGLGYAVVFPRQSLRRGRSKSSLPQGSGFQDSKPYPDTLLSEFPPPITLAWFTLDAILRS
jgi:hypothetical protein